MSQYIRLSSWVDLSTSQVDLILGSCPLPLQTSIKPMDLSFLIRNKTDKAGRLANYGYF